MAKRFGKKIGKSTEEKANQAEPTLPEHLLLHFNAFKDLSRQRSMGGFALGNIPYLDIVQYAQIYRMDEETTEDLIYFVTGLDDHYLSRLNKEHKSKMDKQKTRNNIGKR
jgi:vacuolar-type H+-ATPase subunit C/Vma6